MSGWIVPPPSQPRKSQEDLRRERESKVAELARSGLLRSDRGLQVLALVHPTGQKSKKYPQVEGLPVVLSKRYAKIRRTGTAADPPEF